MGSSQSIVDRTTVANATISDIYVVCEGERNCNASKYTLEIYSTAFGYGTEQTSIKPEMGVMKIQSGKLQTFHLNCSKNVYLTILYLDENYKCKEICRGHEIPNNRNVVITQSGNILLTKGKSTWTDEDGYDHSDDAQKVSDFKEEKEKLWKNYIREVSKLREQMKLKQLSS
ncbi:unnamed protein product [Mytilus coruscus]|uniref:Uncharacterized protein n=1 Tax=Mytilus coruscus TaxID=42192 RepID=A0A6J8A8R5_MYTCO|nr:unnamed protein product [Mytilus coruscus]